MQCARCAGLRVPEIIYEGGSRVLALRCVYCGDVIERVVVLNRQRRRLPHPNRTRTLMYGSDRWRKSRPMMVESHLVSALIPEAVNLARSQSPLFRRRTHGHLAGHVRGPNVFPFCLLGACFKDETIVPF